MKRFVLALSVALMAISSFSSASFAQGDAVKGAKIFKKCKACHTADKGGRTLIGPNLFGIVGLKSAHNKEYKYSKAMLGADLTWDEATLDTFLTKPRAFVKKTKMTFPGLKKEKQRADVIAYLKTLK